MEKRRDLILVARHRLLRDCLASSVERSRRWRVRAEWEDVAGLVETLGESPADVVLIDLTLPQRALRRRLRAIREAWADTKVLLLGPRESERDFLPLVRAGASGYLLHESSLDDVERALNRVLESEPLVSPRIAYALFSRLHEVGRERRRRRHIEALVLTPRELQVLRLVSEGCSNRQIASRLHLSVYTIKNHVHNILDKLGVKRRWQAVEVAARRRWIPGRMAGRPRLHLESGS